jgi:sulfite exporter TauE/SafE
MVAGGLGAAGSAALPTDTAPVVLRVAAALVLVLVGAYLAGAVRWLGRLERVGEPLLRLVQPVVTRALRVESPAGAFAVGLLWGLMPCGMVYAALALALVAGGALAGAATLAAFGLGTLPALLAVGGVAEVVRSLATAPAIRRTAGLLIALSGAVHLTLAGMQAGLIPTGSPSEEAPCCAHGHAARPIPTTPSAM